jgi:hypothetical protein
MGDYRNST